MLAICILHRSEAACHSVKVLHPKNPRDRTLVHPKAIACDPGWRAATYADGLMPQESPEILR